MSNGSGKMLVGPAMNTAVRGGVMRSSLTERQQHALTMLDMLPNTWLTAAELEASGSGMHALFLSGLVDQQPCVRSFGYEYRITRAGTRSIAPLASPAEPSERGGDALVKYLSN